MTDEQRTMQYDENTEREHTMAYAAKKEGRIASPHSAKHSAIGKVHILVLPSRNAKADESTGGRDGRYRNRTEKILAFREHYIMEAQAHIGLT